MFKSLLTKWNIFTFIAVISFATIIAVAASIPEPVYNDIISNRAEYVLSDESGKTLTNIEMKIESNDLVNNNYLNKIYLKKLSTEDAYLRIFINVSKQSENRVYSLDNYNNSNINYTINTSNYIDGTTIADEYAYDDEKLKDVNFCWKYYKQKVKEEKIELFNTISFQDGIEDNYYYIVKINVEMKSVSEFDATTQWLDKPASWINSVV